MLILTQAKIDGSSKCLFLDIDILTEIYNCYCCQYSTYECPTVESETLGSDHSHHFPPGKISSGIHKKSQLL